MFVQVERSISIGRSGWRLAAVGAAATLVNSEPDFCGGQRRCSGPRTDAASSAGRSGAMFCIKHHLVDQISRTYCRDACGIVTLSQSRILEIAFPQCTDRSKIVSELTSKMYCCFTFSLDFQHSYAHQIGTCGVIVPPLNHVRHIGCCHFCFSFVAFAPSVQFAIGCCCNHADVDVDDDDC